MFHGRVLQSRLIMRNYRAAVIGRTGRGNYGHMLDLVWKQFPNVQVVAVADDDPEGLSKAAARLGAKGYSDFRELLKREKPDVVSVASRWADCHEEMVTACAQAGASVYLEKPMARTPAEADRMLAACDRAGVKLAVAHQMRISPILEMAKQCLAQGAIGRLQELRGRGKEDKRAGGEDLMVLGTHVFDLMRQFAGDPLWAFGRVTAEGADIRRRDVHDGPEGLGPIAGDAVAGVFAFRGGLTGYFASRRSDEASGKRWGLDLYGSRGILTIRAAPEEPSVHLCRSAEWTAGAWERVTLPPGTPPRDIHGANAALVADLLEAIEQNREPKASGREARWTIEMAMALYESQRTGARVHLPLKNRQSPLES